MAVKVGSKELQGSVMAGGPWFSLFVDLVEWQDFKSKVNVASHYSFDCIYIYIYLNITKVHDTYCNIHFSEVSMQSKTTSSAT